MRTQRSSISFSYQQGQKSSRSRGHKRQQQNIENLCIDFGEQLAHIRKQLKTKVSRSQFLSSLSSKLSISQLSSLNIGVRSNKQNQVPNHANQDLIDRLQSQINQIEQTMKTNEQALSLRINQQVNAIRQLVEQCSKQLPKFEQQLTHRNSLQKQRLSEIQAYMFKKADRSQIDKLFTLNQLLVIQIEQAKRKSQQINKILNARNNQLLQQVKYLEEKQSEKSQNIDHIIQVMHQQMNTQFKQHSLQIDRILDILQLKQNQRQHSNEVSANLVNNYNLSLSNMNQRLSKLQMQENLSFKQMTTRMNVLQLKQSQVSRAVKEVDSMRTQLETIKLDISELYGKTSEVNVNIRQFCLTTATDTRNLLQAKINKQMQVMCTQIMKKVISLTDQLVTNQQLEQVTNPLKDKYRQINNLQTQHSKKIDFLDHKQMQLLENIQQQTEKTEERLSLMRKEMLACATQKQLLDVQEKCVKVDEIKLVGKQIDKKINMEINKVVEQQNKINQVICSQNIIAKWFWTQGTLKGGNLVAWDKQIINTLPQNFKWVKNEPQVIISKSGYYKIQLGFYSKKKPTVQLIVNGQTIVSAVNSSSYVLHHSSGKLKDVSNSQISGLTYVDFLLLPDGARIAISYIGQFSGQGFLSIQRL